ncbi:hypothetical protein H4V99_001894 [Cryobacterium sp. CG_9.6]|nr:hypothetical protein [Cryobacterium sp. CG_9.6]
MQPLKPIRNIGDAVADLPSNPNAEGTSPIGAQIVNGQYMHAEIVGELTCGEDGLKFEPQKSLFIQNP